MNHHASQPNPREGGAATLLVLAVAGAVLGAGAVGSAVAGAVLLRHRAAVAADSAALGAAIDAAVGPAVACARGGEAARANGARLVACTVRDAIATVTVTSTASGWWAWLPAVQLNARAGPAETFREERTPLDHAS